MLLPVQTSLQPQSQKPFRKWWSACCGHLKGHFGSAMKRAPITKDGSSLITPDRWVRKSFFQFTFHLRLESSSTWRLDRLHVINYSSHGQTMVRMFESQANANQAWSVSWPLSVTVVGGNKKGNRRSLFWDNGTPSCSGVLLLLFDMAQSQNIWL